VTLPEPSTLIAPPHVANVSINDGDPTRQVDDHHGWQTKVRTLASNERHSRFLHESAGGCLGNGKMTTCLKKFKKLVDRLCVVC